MAKLKYFDLIEPRLVEIEGWARDGLTEEQIAKNLGISRSTLSKYKNQYPDFLDTLKRGKEVIDREVESSLLKRAIGYRYNEVTQEPVMNKETGESTLITTKIVTKEVIPDTTAQIFWLKNRKPDVWRDKKAIEHEGEIKQVNPYAGLTEEQLLKIAELDIDA